MRRLVTDLERDLAGGDWLAVIDDDGEWQMSEVMAEAHQLASALQEAGPLRPTLLVQSENSRRLVAAAVAVGMVDGTLALASAHFTADEVATAVDAVRPDVVLGDPAQLALWQLDQSLDLGVGLWNWSIRQSPTRAVVELDRWGGGVVVGMTSGSTGRSKGVVHGEPALTYATREFISAAGLARGDAVGVIVPISAAPAFAFGIYLSMELRGVAVLSRTWDPRAALGQLVQSRSAWLMCVPTQVLQLSAVAGEDRPLRHMKAITVGGGPMHVETMSEAERRLGVTIMRVFGLSECIGHTTPDLDDPPDIRLGRDGRPFPGTHLRVVDDDDELLPPGSTGRAQVRGPSLFLGYAERGRLAPPALTTDGYLETGDLVTTFHDGTISVVGRAKEVVIRGGRNISIAEVEESVSRDPRVRDVCAVPVPDALLGEKVAVLVAGDPGLELADLLVELERRGVSRATWPEYLVVTDELPRSPVGKTSRADARVLVLNELNMEEA